MADDVRCDACKKIGRRRRGTIAPSDWLYIDVEVEDETSNVIVYACSQACALALWKTGPGSLQLSAEGALAPPPDPVAGRRYWWTVGTDEEGGPGRADWTRALICVVKVDQSSDLVSYHYSAENSAPGVQHMSLTRWRAKTASGEMEAAP